MNKKILLIGVPTAIVGGGAIAAVSVLAIEPAVLFKVGNKKDYVVNNDKINSAYELTDNNATNIYFFSAIYPWQFSLKHALLSKNKTILAPYIWQTNNRAVHALNQKAFLNFKKQEKLESEVWNEKSENSFIREVTSYIKKNKKEKINIFVNQYHFSKITYHLWNVVKNLSAFPNVRLVFVEDGSESFANYIDKKYVPPQLEKESLNFSKNLNIVGRADLLKTHPEAKKIFIPNDLPKISDALFNSRDSKGVRLYNAYNLISGFDYKEGLKLLNDVSSNGKKSLMILGTYDGDDYLPREIKFLKWIYDNYATKYNIFYKGHPGHFESSKNIQKIINSGMTDNKKVKIHLLDTFIPSEEFTDFHIAEGMKFDKFISAGITGSFSNIIKGNGYNTYSDILGYWNTAKNHDFNNKLDIYPKS